MVYVRQILGPIRFEADDVVDLMRGAEGCNLLGALPGLYAHDCWVLLSTNSCHQLPR